MMSTIRVDIREPHTIEFDENRSRTLEKYATHIKADLYRLRVECEVLLGRHNALFVKTTLPIDQREKEKITRQIKAAMYNLGVNVAVDESEEEDRRRRR